MTAQVSPLPFTPARALPNGELFYSPLGVFPFQADHVAEAYLQTEPGFQEGVIAVHDTGLGKAQPISEPVLTPEGWVPIGKIQRGDLVIGANGHPVRVRSIHPQTSRTVYRVTFSDGSWTRCAPDHLWTVRRWRTGRKGLDGKQRPVLTEQTITTEEIMRVGIKDSGGRRRWQIPMVKPVQYPQRALPVKPYDLGVILGDGTITETGYVQMTTDKEIIDSLGVPGVRSYYESDGIEVLSSAHWKRGLMALGLTSQRPWEKFVPEAYLHAGEHDRRALLAGLLDTDGSPIANGGAEFSSTSEALVDAVIELVESLGGVARNKTSRITTYSHNGESREGRLSWRVNVKLVESPFRLARKKLRWVQPTKYQPQRYIESITPEPDEDSVCIKIANPNGLYVTRHHIVTHNTILAMDLSSLLFEDNKIDLVMVIAERNKIKEWKDDIERFTALDAHLYHGTGRQKRLLRDGAPHCFITTYETGRNELMTRVKREGKRSRAMIDGPLVETLGLRGKRILWVFDEVMKLRTRSSELHQAYAYLLGQLRRGPNHQRVLGLTATPVEKDFVDTYNVGRICFPALMPTVASFEEAYTRGKDDYGRYRFKNAMKPVFADLIAPVILRKRKTDADVIAQFPKQIEEVIRTSLTGEHAKLYQAVRDMFDEPDDPALWLASRMTAGHPCAHLHAPNPTSRLIVEELGEEVLRSIPSSKSAELLERLRPIVKGQGAQVVVFTFFGQTVLPELHRELTEAGYTVATYHGGKSRHANDDAKDRFKSGHVEILLCSDAAARGLNLAEAEYVIEYESALTYANRLQRINRVHRIDSAKPIVTCFTMIADGTVEERIFENTLRRNADMDTLLRDTEDGSEFISAQQRRQMFQASRTR